VRVPVTAVLGERISRDVPDELPLTGLPVTQLALGGLTLVETGYGLVLLSTRRRKPRPERWEAR